MPVPVPAEGLDTTLRCAACGATYRALVAVTCVAEHHRTVGGCCAGFRHHDITYRLPGAPPGTTGEIAFRVWAQDPVWIAPGDVFTVLIAEQEPRCRGRRPFPDAVANLTLAQYWPLVAPTAR